MRSGRNSGVLNLHVAAEQALHVSVLYYALEDLFIVVPQTRPGV